MAYSNIQVAAEAFYCCGAVNIHFLNQGSGGSLSSERKKGIRTELQDFMKNYSTKAVAQCLLNSTQKPFIEPILLELGWKPTWTTPASYGTRTLHGYYLDFDIYRKSDAFKAVKKAAFG